VTCMPHSGIHLFDWLHSLTAQFYKSEQHSSSGPLHTIQSLSYILPYSTSLKRKCIQCKSVISARPKMKCLRAKIRIHTPSHQLIIIYRDQSDTALGYISCLAVITFVTPCNSISRSQNGAQGYLWSTLKHACHVCIVRK